MLTTFKDIKDDFENINRELETIKSNIESQKNSQLEEIKNTITDYKFNGGEMKQLYNPPIDNDFKKRI